MKNNTRFIASGGIFIIVLTIIVFSALTLFMNTETEKDVRTVAEVQLDGISREQLHKFESITEIRFNQIENLIDEIAVMGSASDYKTLSAKIAEICDFQNLTAIALVSPTGDIVTVSGNKIVSIDNKEKLLTALRNNEKFVTSGEAEETGQVIAYGKRVEYPMPNGQRSIGILCVRYISMFTKMMNLTDSDSIIYKHILRPDGTYLVKNNDSVGKTFFDKVLTCTTPFDMTAEEAVNRMKVAMNNEQEFSMSVEYNNSEMGISERRTVLAVPMDRSDWYLVVVMPYRVLDTTIESMGNSRSNAMFISVGILALGILSIFAIYYRMSQHQMVELANAKANAEKLMVEAEEARQEAEDAKEEVERSMVELAKAKDNAEKLMLEAEEARQEAEDSREEAERSMVELAKAKENAEKLMLDAEEARQEAEDSREEAERSMVQLAEAKENAEKLMVEAEEARQEAEDSREEALAAQAETVRLKDEAERANKAKSEFLSNMSHDIRTPMNAIIGMTTIAKDNVENPVQIKECLRKINMSSKQLLGLINDILDMSKIESGKMSLTPELISLRETMEAMCDIIRPQIKIKNQEFEILISNIISEEVFCDGVRLNQILINLLGNAVKFTPEGGSVTLSLLQEPSPKSDKMVRCHLYVKDTGIGMSEEFKQKLFTAFEREDNKRVHRTEGSGLGMAITKYIVDAMHGTIEVNSKTGKGTEFHITLDFEKGDSSTDMHLPNWNVLIADDDKELCTTAIASLKEIGVTAEAVSSGEDAVEKIKEYQKENKKFDVVLIDYKMQGINGVETVKRIREIIGDDLPVVLISAYDWTEFEDEARTVGTTGFISKPLFKSTLYHELSKYIEKNNVKKAPEAAEDKKITLTGMKILLVEDIDINAQIAQTLLEMNGAEVEHAEDGKIAVDMFTKSEVGYYNLILMDLRMPNMNGFEATEEIRKMTRSDAAKIPIIAMTADAFADDVQKCLDIGMNAHIAKPIDLDLLLKTLSKYV